MNELVRIEKDDVFTDSLIIANGTGNEHESVVALIKKYDSKFKQIGKIRFTDLKSGNPKGGRPTRIYLLNEIQATFLMTLLSNSDSVVEFKLELVKQFYAMRQKLLKLLADKQTHAWQETRQLSKSNRRLETDEIKKFVQYALSNGSKNADKYYISFSKLANNAVGLNSNQRDIANVAQLNSLTLIENIIGIVIIDGIKQGLYYKDIYKNCKTRIEKFKDVAFLRAAA